MFSTALQEAVKRNPLHSLTYYAFMIYFNIIFQYNPRSLKCLIVFSCTEKTFVHNSNLYFYTLQIEKIIPETLYTFPVLHSLEPEVLKRPETIRLL